MRSLGFKGLFRAPSALSRHKHSWYKIAEGVKAILPKMNLVEDKVYLGTLEQCEKCFEYRMIFGDLKPVGVYEIKEGK